MSSLRPSLRPSLPPSLHPSPGKTKFAGKGPCRGRPRISITFDGDSGDVLGGLVWQPAPQGAKVILACGAAKYGAAKDLFSGLEGHSPVLDLSKQHCAKRAGRTASAATVAGSFPWTLPATPRVTGKRAVSTQLPGRSWCQPSRHGIRPLIVLVASI